MSVSDSSTASPDFGSATQSTSTETDAYPTNTTTTNTSSVLEIEPYPGTASTLVLFSTSSNDGTGNSIATSYANKQEIDDLGTAAGVPWSNNPTANVTETTDAMSSYRQIASDGSYNETDSAPNGGQATISIDGAEGGTTLDGGGTYHLNVGAQCNGEVIFLYGPPTAGSITLTITDWAPNSKGICTKGSKTRTFPAWFTVPSGAGSGYVTDNFVDNGAVNLPQACNGVKPAVTTANNQVVETYNVLDPVLGYTETRTTTSYDVSGYGPVCVSISDTLSDYYDYSDNTTRIDYQSQNGQPNSVNTITETLTMNGTTCGSGGSGPCAQVRRADSVQAVSPAVVAARVAAIELHRAVQRARGVEALRRFALHFARGGAAR
jgi:hypothetical protein